MCPLGLLLLIEVSFITETILYVLANAQNTAVIPKQRTLISNGPLKKTYFKLFECCIPIIVSYMYNRRNPVV
jgi:hypothetical protein